MYSKAIYKFVLKDFIVPIIIFYGVIAGIYLLIIPSTINSNNATGQFNGMESATAIFLFICGLNSFKEIFHFSLQNGISRKTFFNSNLMSFFTIVTGMAIIDKFVLLIGKAIVGTNGNMIITGLIEQIYMKRYLGNSSDLAMHIEGFLFNICLYAAFLLIGYFITIAYYKMNKGLKIGVSVGVPVGLFIVLPLVESTLTNGKITAFIGNVLSFALGFDNNYNPYYGMVTFIIISVVFGALSLILISKSVVHD